MGSDQAVVTRLLTTGASPINTMAKLAFSSSNQPGVGTDDLFVEAIVRALGLHRPDEIAAGNLAGFRRIWYEAHSVCLADFRQRTERTEDMPPRRLPVPERAAKLAAQRLRLLGVSITGMLTPSHSLIDYCMTMRDEETLRYVAPDKCTAREQELAGMKRE